LRAWRANTDAHGTGIEAQGLPLEFRRMWRLYLADCEAAFLERRVSDVQLLLRAADAAPIERVRSTVVTGGYELDGRERAATVGA
jgi:hypothetical protein